MRDDGLARARERTKAAALKGMSFPRWSESSAYGEQCGSPLPGTMFRSTAKKPTLFNLQPISTAQGINDCQAMLRHANVMTTTEI